MTLNIDLMMDKICMHHSAKLEFVNIDTTGQSLGETAN